MVYDINASFGSMCIVNWHRNHGMHLTGEIGQIPLKIRMNVMLPCVVLSPGQTIAACRNIVGNNILRAFGHLVATCCDMLQGAAKRSQHLSTTHPQHLQALAKRSQHLWVQHVASVWPPCCDVLRHVGY